VQRRRRRHIAHQCRHVDAGRADHHCAGHPLDIRATDAHLDDIHCGLNLDQHRRRDDLDLGDSDDGWL
jgi:hypothetical protein